MSVNEKLTAYQIDALKELTNIGMGRAGAMLSQIFEHRVTLNVPDVSFVDKDQLEALSEKFRKSNQIVNIIHQSFLGDIEGRSTFIIGEHKFGDLVQVMGYEENDANNEKKQQEMLLDISNAVNSACLSGLAEQLGLDVELSQPHIASYNKPNSELKDFIFIQKVQENYDTLLFSIQFYVKDINLYCDNIISIRSTSLDDLIAALEKVI